MSDFTFQSIPLFDASGTVNASTLVQVAEAAMATETLSGEERTALLTWMTQVMALDLTDEVEEKVSDLKVQHDL